MIFEKRTQTRFIIVLLLLIVMYIPLYTLQLKKILELTDEDHLYENFQAVSFLLASCLMFFLYIKTGPENGKFLFKSDRNLFYLFLAIFFFFCFGEEISWGQRIFGFSTPSELLADNAQHETNLHNLWVFQGYDKQEVAKHGLSVWITSNRIFALIWLFYCVLVPLSNKLSLRLHNLYKKIQLPIIPLWLASLFIVAEIISKIAQKFYLYSDNQPIYEIKEANFDFLYLLVALIFLEVYLKRRAETCNVHRKNDRHSEAA